MSFSFSDDRPAAPNDPSVDQPFMLINNQSTKGILAVDHITFDALGGGEHKQVTFNSKNVPTTQTDPKSVLYTNNITEATTKNTVSASSVASLFFRNQNSGTAPDNFSFPVSMIRAFGCFDGAAMSVNTWNMSATRASVGVFNITLATGVVSGTNFSVQVSVNTSTTDTAHTYSITGVGTISLTFGVLAGRYDPTQFSVLVMQL